MVERTLETTYNKDNADVTYDVISMIWEAVPDNNLFRLGVRFV